jgi:hypothetical protein
MQLSPQALMTYALNIMMASDSDPLTVQEALDSSDREKWKEAMREEWHSILLNNTFEAATTASASQRPTSKPISSKWVFKKKRNADNSIRYKARLVIRGFEQLDGSSDTYAPVSKLTTLRYMLALAVQHNWNIQHLDVVTAFLHPEVDEDVYMKLPAGVEWLDPVLSRTCNWVKLKKALYGLRKAPKLWFDAINGFLLSLGFTQSEADPNLYSKQGTTGSAQGDIHLLLYVDDILLFYPQTDAGKCDAELVTNALMAKFKMKDLGVARQFLGLEISRDSDTISLGQEKYVNDIIARFGMQDAFDVPTPLDPDVKLDAAAGSKPADTRRYQSIVGSLMYAALGTRPDIAYAVAALCRYNAAPTAIHMTAAVRVLRYLKATARHKLVYRRTTATEPSVGYARTTESFVGYADSEWAGDSGDRKSQGGFVFMMNSGAISWSSRKQTLVALSTLEAEYIACSSAAREAKWLRQLSLDVKNTTDKRPATIFSDNQGALKTIYSGATKANTKHIDVQYHNSRDLHHTGVLSYTYVKSSDNIADVMTKALHTVQHDALTRAMGLRGRPMELPRAGPLRQSVGRFG